MPRDRTTEPAVRILHENDEWMPPFVEALERAGVPHVLHPLTGGSIALGAEPPEGVFWSRLSASSPSRGHAHAKEVARAVLRWAEAHGRRVVNGSAAVELEVSKAAQYAALVAAGFDVPRTIAVFDPAELPARARELPLPLITKHNQGGKGLGVRRFDDYAELDAHVARGGDEAPVDGVTLLQEHVTTAEPFVTRAEFVGGAFVYAVRVDTSAGSFELCPADACVVPDAAGGTGAAGADLATPPPAFARREDVDAQHPLIRRLAEFLAANGVEVAGVEFFETADGRLMPYDINTNTNYNPDVERDAPVRAADAVAAFLGRELEARYPGSVTAGAAAREAVPA